LARRWQDEGLCDLGAQGPCGGGTAATVARIHLHAEVKSELWTRIGRALIAKLQNRDKLSMTMDVAFEVPAGDSAHIGPEIEQALTDLGLTGTTEVELG